MKIVASFKTFCIYVSAILGPGLIAGLLLSDAFLPVRLGFAAITRSWILSALLVAGGIKLARNKAEDELVSGPLTVFGVLLAAIVAFSYISQLGK